MEENTNNQPHEKVKALDRFIGTWEVSDPSTSDDIAGKVRFEWMPGKFFLMQHIDFNQGGQIIKGLEVIGYDADRDILSTHYFDNSGHNFTYDWQLEGDELTIWFGQKGSDNYFHGAFSEDGNSLRGEWQWPGGGYKSIMQRVTE